MRILHVSDLHFGRTADGSAHMFHAGGVPTPARLAKLLLKADKPDLIVMSGDLAWSGADEDYGYVKHFVSAIRTEWSGIEIATAPGNHDVWWGAPDGAHQRPYCDFLREVYGAEFDRTYPFVAAHPDDRNYLVGFHEIETGSTKATVVTVNSVAEQKTSGQPVYVDRGVLDAIKTRLGVGAPATLRIFVLHHHLLPFVEPNTADTLDALAIPEADPTIVANSAELQRWLDKNGFHLVLHGHKHRPHGRRDTLWSSGSGPSSPRRLFIIGAGSAGVMKSERAGGEDPLSVNTISAIPAAEGRWNVGVSVTKLADDRESITEDEILHYDGSVGPRSKSARFFHAADTAVCHQLIREGCTIDELITNFISVVDTSEYRHPATAIFKGNAATQEDVHQSFLALHPEFNTARGLDVDLLNDAGPRRGAFRFEHGRRMFAEVQSGETGAVRPFETAVNALRSGTSHAYLGLYRPDIDASPQPREPMPCLVGLQFIPEGPFLDAVATFRKLELSFWWCVNMYEVAELLTVAARRGERKKPRRITFFAALAQWKRETEVTLTPALDKQASSELIPLVVRAASGDVGAVARLTDLLEEKATLTDEKNLDDTGLADLHEVASGLLNAGTSTLSELVSAVNEALKAVRFAVRLQNHERPEQADRAIVLIRRAVDAVRRLAASATAS